MVGGNAVKFIVAQQGARNLAGKAPRHIVALRIMITMIGEGSYWELLGILAEHNSR